MKSSRTRKQFRQEIADEIKEVADFSDNGAIQCLVSLIRDCLKQKDYEKVEEHLKSIEECCKTNHSKIMQCYHSFEMMRHLALAIGEKYDPMY